MTESSQKCLTPRQRFVEALRPLYEQHVEVCHCTGVAPYKCLAELAAEAFVDAECGGHYRVKENSTPAEEHQKTCVASILKEIFGE